MKVFAATVLCGLLCSAVSASSKVKDEHRTAFFGEDLYINVPPKDLGELVFRPRTNRSLELVLLQEGLVVPQLQPQSNISGPEVKLISPGHITLENLQEKHEGLYIIKNNASTVVKRLVVIVTDCAVEQIIKYGDHYDIHLNHVEGPIALEFRPSALPTNHTDTEPTEPPPVLLFNQTVLLEEYERRLSVSEGKVTLRRVRMSDEGSYTVMDRTGKVRTRNCLNVREHQTFIHLTYGSDFTLNLYLDHSNLNVVYRPKSLNQDWPIVEQGVVVSPLDPQLEGRLSVGGAVIHIKKLKEADTGVFKVTDLAGFSVAHVYIEVEPYKLPSLTVAILSLLGLVAFMLLVCLLSCLYKVHKRNEKNKRLQLLAEQSGKSDGEAFRQSGASCANTRSRAEPGSRVENQACRNNQNTAQTRRNSETRGEDRTEANEAKGHGSPRYRATTMLT
uniref:Uncharacterized protein n=1 Tax=Neogobius melanostomus TaxID=47308 RepID=A0A8C6UBQ7_9GOBI